MPRVVRCLHAEGQVSRGAEETRDLAGTVTGSGLPRRQKQLTSAQCGRSFANYQNSFQMEMGSLSCWPTAGQELEGFLLGVGLV